MTKMSIDQLKDFIKRYVSTRIVGYLAILDTVCLSKTGKRVIDLLLSSPSMLYKIISEYYGGASETTDFVMLMFLKAIAIAFNELGLEYRLLELAKSGKDEEFRKIIEERLRKK